MSQNNIEQNHQQLTQQQKASTLENFQRQRHQYIVEGINDVNGMSNFDCEWIDNEESPHRAAYQNFPSDIELGLDGVNVGSNHHLGMNHVEYNIHNDISINNESQYDRSRNHQLQQQSYMSTDSNVKEKNMVNILGDDLELLNDSKEIDISKDGFEKSSSQNDDFFDGENNMISQIQPSQEYHGQQLLNDENVQQDQHNYNQNIFVKHDYKLNEKPKENVSSINQLSIHEKSVQKIDQNSKEIIEQNSTFKQESHSLSSTEKQNTVVINQHSFLSKIYEDLSSTDHSKLLKSMVHYIETNQTSYKPYYTLLQTLYLNSKVKSDKSIDNFNMYADFFKQKTKQIEKYLKQAQSQKTQKLFQNLKTKEINNLVYVDTKVVLRDIHERNIKKVKLYRVFYKQIQQISNQFKKCVSQIYQRRHSLEKQIVNALSLIKSLQNQLEKMIEYRVNYDRMKSDPEFNIAAKQLFRVQNPHVAKDQYLQIKVIIEKQAFYISKLKQLRVQVIKYITLTFLTDQIFVSAKIKENLINYTQLLIEVQKLQKSNAQSQDDTNLSENAGLQILQRKKNLLNQKKIHEQLKIELTKRLYECIPQILKSQIGIQEDQKLTCEDILESLNTHFQNQVFFPSIQLDEEYVFYRSEGSWISRQQYKEMQESKKNSNSQGKQEFDQLPNNISLKLVLTVNKYLHMEQNEKIATLKINEIKIAKKGKYLIISDRGKGIVGFLVNNGNQLGRIKFKSLEDADFFAQKLRQLVQQK